MEDESVARLRIEEGLVDFDLLQCPLCGGVGGLEALGGSTSVVVFAGCRHRIHGEVAEAYLVRAFPGPGGWDAPRVIAAEINLGRLLGSVPISTFEGDRSG